MSKKSGEIRTSSSIDACPHCGYKLSPWQQVLLGVDKTLVCKNCWYRIIVDPFEVTDEEEKGTENKNKNKPKKE